jgi:REP element-mobilizing transposase RayT
MNMQEQFEKMGCEVLIINGYHDHVHCLFSMGRNHSISEIIKQVKGESSFYINSLAITGFHFLWQSGYAAFSVNEKNYDRLYKYILNQKVHHENNRVYEIFELPPLRFQTKSVE